MWQREGGLGGGLRLRVGNTRQHLRQGDVPDVQQYSVLAGSGASSSDVSLSLSLVPGVQPAGAERRGGGEEGGEAAGSRVVQSAVVQLRTLRHVLSVRHRRELPDLPGDDKHLRNNHWTNNVD